MDLFDFEPQEEQYLSSQEGYSHDTSTPYYRQISTMEILKDKEELDKRNLRYISDSFEWDDRALKALRDKFGLQDFRENQRGIINATMSGQDCLGLIPTGGGKSLTF